MELFKFDTTYNLQLSQGKPILGAKSLMWAERYRAAGEFEIVADLSSGLREFLPLGTLISHMNTLELMMVENHQIKDDGENSPEIVITGRSLEAFLENRIVGGNQTFPISPLTNYEIAGELQGAAYQAKALIEDHIHSPNTPYFPDLLSGITIAVEVNSSSSYLESQPAKILKRGPLYKEVLDLLAEEDFGIQVQRPDGFSPLTFTLHDGYDKRSDIIFSWQVGDLDDAEYLWSNKKLKTQAIVTGKWTEIRYPTTSYTTNGYNHRVVHIDGTDIDDKYETAPIGTTLLNVQTQMERRAKKELASQKIVEISRVDIAKTARFKYRSDYNIGDIVRVDGNYGAIDTMRVIEHVEIMDENETTSHPTLEVYKGKNPNIT